MRFVALSVFLAFLLHLGCSDSTGPGDKNDNAGTETPFVSSASIDSQGGLLVKDSMTLDIPSGSFTGEFHISLKKAEHAAFDSDDIEAVTYSIEGIPQSFDKPFELRINLGNEYDDSTLLAVGETVWVKSRQEEREMFRFIASDIVDGDIVGVIPPLGKELALGKRTGTGSDETLTLKIQAVRGYSPVTSAEGHFRIDYPPASVSRAAAERLAGYLEEAYRVFDGMNFDYSARTSWPVSVTVKDLGNTVYGEYCSSMWGHNYGYMEFNSRFMDNEDELRTTAGHEFFHLVQAFYDPRNAYSRAKLETPHLWLEEACAVWSEELFSDNDNYVSPVRAGNTQASYKGVEPVSGMKDALHGYGLSAMIKYLVETYGADSLEGMFRNILDGSLPVTSVIRATAEPVEWWEPFLRSYSLGKIYGMTLGELTANKTGMFRIQSESDTLYTDTAEYRDLSGQVYIIRLEDAQSLESATMECSIDDGMGELSLFSYNFERSEITFIGTDTEKITASGLDGLAKSDTHILALVSNSRSISLFTDSSSIEFTTRIIPPEPPEVELNKFVLSFSRVGGKGFNSDGEPVELSDLLMFSYLYDGVLEGNVFSAEVDVTSGKYHTVGDFSYTFDTLFETITEFDVSVYTEYDGNKVTMKLKGGGLPYKGNNQGWRQYFTKNTDIETALTSFYYRYDSRSGGRYELDTVIPNDRSQLKINFIKE